MTFSISMYIMCVILCLFSALSHRVDALQISTIIIIIICWALLVCAVHLKVRDWAWDRHWLVRTNVDSDKMETALQVTSTVLIISNCIPPHSGSVTQYFSHRFVKCGKIQGDGRKFLDRLKSSFGSQISSQSLIDVHIYRLLQKSAKRWVLSYILVFERFELAHHVALWPSFPVTM